MTHLFNEQATFVSDKKTQLEVFKEVSQKLLDLDLVTQDFEKNLIDREKNYPTGMDLEIVNPLLKNIAIPHTEPEFVKAKLIVPIKLNQPITFSNMIKPDEFLEVSYLFMILNNDPEGQANLLAMIMEFLTSTSPETLTDFFTLTDTKEINQFLEHQFKINN